MLTFWLLAIILFIIAIAFVLYPLIRKTSTKTKIDQKQINVDIAKEQMASLEINFASGEISQEEYDSLKYELESTLIDDISQSKQPTQSNSSNQDKNQHNLIFMGFILIFIPLCSLLFYQKLGTPEFIESNHPQQISHNAQQEDGQKPSVEEMITVLKDKLKENPKDQKGWFLLARTYMALKQYDEAYQMYKKLISLTGEDATILVSMADALAMTKGGKISGDPEKLIYRALKIEPNNITGLWLAGIAQKEQGNLPKALSYWTKLYPLTNDDPAAQESIAKMIQSVGGTPPDSHASHNHEGEADLANLASEISIAQDPQTQPKSEHKFVEVSISLSAEMLAQASPNDMVFIYAKASSGPPMPLAALKKKVSDLPITVKLDDSMAMTPQMKISSFSKIKVGARVSKSGQPIKQPGDLMSQEVSVDINNSTAVKLLINTVVK